MNELKLCKCGEVPQLEKIYTNSHMAWWYEVKCPRCGKSSGIKDTEQSAVNAWNRKVKTSQP